MVRWVNPAGCRVGCPGLRSYVSSFLDRRFLPRGIPATSLSDAARADQQSGALPTLQVRHAECSRSSPRGRRQRLPGGRETATLPPRPPPVGRFARDGRHTALVEDRLRRSVPAPASLLSCRPDRARSRCPTAAVCHWPSVCTLF